MEVCAPGCTRTRTDFPWGIGLHTGVVDRVDNLNDLCTYYMYIGRTDPYRQFISLVRQGPPGYTESQRTFRLMAITRDFAQPSPQAIGYG